MNITPLGTTLTVHSGSCLRCVACRGCVVLAFILNDVVAGTASGVRPCYRSSPGRFPAAYCVPTLTRNRPKGLHSRWDIDRKPLSGRGGAGEGPRTRGTQQGRK